MLWCLAHGIAARRVHPAALKDAGRLGGEAVEDEGWWAWVPGVHPVSEFVLGEVDHEGTGLFGRHLLGDDEPLFLCLTAVCGGVPKGGIVMVLDGLLHGVNGPDGGVLELSSSGGPLRLFGGKHVEVQRPM